MSGKIRTLLPIIVCVTTALILNTAGVKAKDDPCKADLERLCKEVRPGQGRIANCLKEHEAELSPECKSFRQSKMDEMKERSNALQQACGKDVEQFCKDIQPGQGRLARCLKEHKAQLSQECTAYWEGVASGIKHKMESIKEACTQDLERFCKDVQPGQGRLARCLKEHSSEISAECKASMEK
jgi:gas vesicle protein